MPSYTNVRTRQRQVFALAWQSARGTPAAPSAAVPFLAKSVSVKPGRVYIDPQGTTGTRFMVDTVREVGEEPAMEIEAWGSIELLPTLLEASFLGQTSVASGDVSIANDTDTAFSSVSFVGVRPGFNTDWASIGAAKLYVTVTDGGSGTGHSVDFYSDSARTKLVGRVASVDDNATASIAEQNNSGLSGSVTMGTVTQTNATIEMTISKVSIGLAAQPARFLTAFRDTGFELETLQDCVVQELSLSSNDKEALVVKATLVGTKLSKGASAISSVPAHVSVYAHAGLSLVRDPSGLNVPQACASIEAGVRNELFMPLANSATRITHVLRGVELPLKTTHAHADEAQAMIDDGDAGTWRGMRAEWAYGSNLLSIDWPRVRPKDPSIPDVQEDGVAPVELEWDVRQDQALSADPISITYQP